MWIYTSGVIIVAIFVALVANAYRSPEARARALLVAPEIGSGQRPQNNISGTMDTVPISQPIEFEISGTIGNESPEVNILDVQGNTHEDIKVETKASDGGKWQVKVYQSDPNKRPGKFKAEVKDRKDGTIIHSQDFVWGVLAFNSNLATYKTGSQANLAMAVLDDEGKMVCNAAMAMIITDPTGRTTVLGTGNDTIRVNPSCSVYGATPQPDYSATYKTSRSGKYDVKLYAKLNGGERILHDSFWAEENPQFIVERSMATRAFPPATNTASIFITSREDYVGKITEKLPDEFEISADGAEISETDGIKTITWDINLQKGHPEELKYQFSTPNISPQLYEVGPLEIGSWREARAWQIANDAIAKTDLTSGSSAVGASSYTTASITPTSNSLVLVWIENHKASSPPETPTLSGNGITWTQINTETLDTTGTPLKRITAFRGLNASPSSGAITIDFGGATQSHCIWNISEYSGVDTTTPIVQSAINNVDAFTSLTVTLGAFGSVNNATAAGFASDSRTSTINPKASPAWTEIYETAIVSAPYGRLETQWYNGNDTTAVGTMSSGTSDMGGIAVEINASGGAFTISGTCKQVDHSSNCSNGETVKVAYDTTLKVQTGTTSSGAWTITPDAAPSSGQVITIFIDGVASANESNAVTKYDGSGNISGVSLYEENLTLGSDDNQTLTNANIATYDNSVSGDEDIFFDVDANNDLTIDTTGDLTQEKLYIKTSNTYRPDSGSSGDLNTHDIQIDGTVTADGNTLKIGGSWDNNATFTANTSLVKFTNATVGATETIDSTGATTASFNNFEIATITTTWNLSSALDVNGNMALSTGALDMNGAHNITLAGNLTIGPGEGTFTKGTGTFTFDGSGTNTWTDYYDVDRGAMIVNGSSKTLNLATSVKATSFDVKTGQTLGLGSSGYTLTLTGTGTGSSRPLIVSGTLSEGTNSTVKYTGTSATEILDETYYNLELKPASGSPTYTLGAVGGGGTGTPTKIDDTGDPGAILGAGRSVVRTSGGTLYAFINDGGSCEIWKSADGSSWTEQDSANNPACSSTNTSVSEAIDSSNVIHMVYVDDGMMSPPPLRYITFDTTGDTFGAEAQVDSTYGGEVDIAIDSNSKPHVVTKYTGIGGQVLAYSNKTGASWRAEVVLESGLSTNIAMPSIAISEDNIPEISYINVADADLTAAVGNANDATSFTLQDVDTSVNVTENQRGSSIAIDSSGNSWVAYVDDSTNYIRLVEHLDGDAWGTWQASVTNSNVGYEPSVAANGTEIYIFYENDANDISYDKYTGGWLGETVVATGTYHDVHTKWAYNFNNGSTVQIDFLYSDGTDIYWNKLILSGGGTGTLAANNFTIGDGTHAITADANTNDPAVDIGGTFTIAASAVYTASATGALHVAGDLTNSGTFTHSSATVSLDGTSTQTITCGSSSFNNITSTNTSGLTFSGNCTTAGTFSHNTGSTTLTFGSGATYAFNAIDIDGALTHLITMVSSSPTNYWLFNVTAAHPVVTYVDATDSNASGGSEIDASDGTSVNGGHNLNWNFGGGSNPDDPTDLAQKKTTDVVIATNGWTNELSVKYTATVSDPDADQVQICVEKQPMGTAFTDTEDGCGALVASGSMANYTIDPQADNTSYHWQARAKDATARYSNWVAFTCGVDRCYGIDNTGPTGGTVYDGTEVGVDHAYNDGSLSALSANWSGFNAGVSGLAYYEYAIGTTSGGTDTKGWTNVAAATAVTSSGLTLHTGQTYYIAVRATDNAGTTGTPVVSNGQAVAPTLTFSFASGGTITFDSLNAGNSYTDAAKTTVLQTSTNAYEGYVTKARATDEMRSPSNPALFIAHYGSPNVAPTTWSGTGFGYTTNDSDLSGGVPDRFTNGGPKFAGFIETGPGDPVADHTALVTGTPITNEQFTITYRITGNAMTAAGLYTTTIIYTCIPQY